MFARLITIAVLISASGPAETATPLGQPIGSWAVERADHECTLLRPYGTAKSPLTLAFIFKSASLNQDGNLLVIRPEKEVRLGMRDAVVIFEPQTHRFETRIAGLQMAEQSKRGISIYLDQEQVELLKQSSTVSIRAGGLINETFLVDQLKAAFESLHQCNVDLVGTWGMPPEQQARLKTQARFIGDAATLISQKDYAGTNLTGVKTSRIGVRLLIDDKGLVENCAILDSSGSEAVDDVVCRGVAKRAKFSPALDVDNKAVKSIVTIRLDFAQ